MPAHSVLLVTSFFQMPYAWSILALHQIASNAPIIMKSVHSVVMDIIYLTEYAIMEVASYVNTLKKEQIMGDVLLACQGYQGLLQD